MRQFVAPKVPAVLLFFWVTKLLTTGIGEAAADFMANDSVVIAAGIGLIGFAAALLWQFRSNTYHPIRYWITVLMVAVFGTMVADGPHKLLGTPYWLNALGCFVALVAVFAIWHRSEGTLSVHSIVTELREAYYWLAVLLTFGLGTALGDLTASTFHLGYGGSILLFAGAILVPLVAWRGGVNSVLCFWAAYVLTRPLGASVADWLGKPAAKTGLGWGDGTVTIIGLVLFAGLVAYAAITHSDEDHEAAAAQYAELANSGA
ncbi:hypothetical protein Back2_18630 [Nocardioides baekrokdamisoli]|uniref:Membrane-anchored protein n=1 Tax=Nocardioides baekrokdamisoli TaxID=1804624 RepID=A0A3G9IGV7_9ACTN|nr:hypothetical protein [Nocardioides baekrokdamisoli]BBH17576.1 hypothetical protein Back2_18630 [Nocardioides baekrokdamisoli]